MRSIELLPSQQLCSFPSFLPSFLISSAVLGSGKLASFPLPPHVYAHPSPYLNTWDLCSQPFMLHTLSCSFFPSRVGICFLLISFFNSFLSPSLNPGPLFLVLWLQRRVRCVRERLDIHLRRRSLDGDAGELRKSVVGVCSNVRRLYGLVWRRRRRWWMWRWRRIGEVTDQGLERPEAWEVGRGLMWEECRDVRRAALIW